MRAKFVNSQASRGREIGVVTNVGYAHIEDFDSIEGIAAGNANSLKRWPRTEPPS